ncbi:MAG: serine/threonine-protein kinase [Planctomycetota bacterium]|nr:serine/threonine-protein kinase [Planctomycetota bacterium]
MIADPDKSKSPITGAPSAPREQPHGLVEPQKFLGAVLRSGLMTRGELKHHLEQLQPGMLGFTEAIADALVEQGALTRFQAGKLKLGISRGLVLGRYSVLSPVAKGGMATVYLGQNLHDRRVVALKVLPPSQAREARHLARFQRESRLNRLVRHPGLCAFHDQGETEGIHYLVMEFVPGKSLQRLVADNGPLPIELAARLGAEVAYALDALHQTGLVHRDVKPSNILVTPLGNARLIDLGLALIIGETGEDVDVIGGQGYIVGSMDYIAPEQTRDPTQVDGRADLYALGCTLYFAVSGKVPFEGGSNKERMRRHREETAPPLIDLVPGIPTRFSNLVQLLMEKDPGERFGSAGMVAADLQLLVPENQALFSAGMDSELVLATLENLRVYNPRERTELESQLLRDTGTEHGPIDLEKLPENWAEADTAERMERGHSSTQTLLPAHQEKPEIPLLIDPAFQGGDSSFLVHSAADQRANSTASFLHALRGGNLAYWSGLPSWQRWMILALLGVWMICLLLTGWILVLGKPGA